jgi:phosphoglycerate dehydrogenase-like enzyme
LALQNQLIVLTNSNTPSALLRQIPLTHIKLLIHPNSGYDNFDPAYVQQAKFPIVLGHPLREAAVTEYILTSLMTASSPIPWRTAWDNTRQFSGRQLMDGQKILLSGFGHIGQRLAPILGGLGAQLFICDPFQTAPLQKALEDGLKAQALAWADVPWPELDSIILAASLNPTSRHQISREVVTQLKQKVILINSARGGLIDEAALALFLEGSGHQAFIDTWENEPHPSFNWQHPRLHASSHVAGVYPELGTRQLAYLRTCLIAWQRLPFAAFEVAYQRELLHHRLQTGPGGDAFLI